MGAGKLSKLLNSVIKGRKYSTPVQDDNRLFFVFLSTGKSASKSVNEWCRRVPCLQREWVVITHRCIVLDFFNLIFSTHCYNKSRDEELVRIHTHFQGELGRLLKTTFQERKTKCNFLMEIRYVHRSCQMYLPIGYIFQQVIQLVTYILSK